MLSAYPACFIKEDTGYSVIFPDLNTATCGDDLEDAFSMAVDCLAGYLYSSNSVKISLNISNECTQHSHPKSCSLEFYFKYPDLSFFCFFTPSRKIQWYL